MTDAVGQLHRIDGKMPTTTEAAKLEVAQVQNASAAKFAIPFALAALVVLLYHSVLMGLILDWAQDPDFGFCFLVPVLAVFLVWRDRERVRRAPVDPSNWGLAWMGMGIVLLLGASLGAELFTSRFSLLVLLTGMILFLAGRSVLRAVLFPLCFLTFMVPLPTLIYNQITFPLQLLSSRFAVYWLQLLGVPTFREGNIVSLPHYTLEVVEACSGIRSLMALVTGVVAYVYLAEKRWWIRIALLATVIPLAIVCNGFRIVGTGLLTVHFGVAAAQGFFHEFQGMIIFLFALVLLFASHRLLRSLGKLWGSRG